MFAVLVLGLATACGDGGLWVSPLGEHDVLAGGHVVAPLVARGGDDPLRWQLVQAPQGALLVGAGRQASLRWTAGVADLAPTAAGQPAGAGPAQRVEIAVIDALGRRATSAGSLRAVPAWVRDSRRGCATVCAAR